MAGLCSRCGQFQFNYWLGVNLSLIVTDFLSKIFCILLSLPQADSTVIERWDVAFTVSIYHSHDLCKMFRGIETGGFVQR